MRLTDIVTEDTYERTYWTVYYAHKNAKDEDGFLNFRLLGGEFHKGVYDDPKDVEYAARKEWARKQGWGNQKPKWNDQNYVFVIIEETVTMVTNRVLADNDQYEKLDLFRRIP